MYQAILMINHTGEESDVWPCLYAFSFWNTRKADGNKYLFYAVGVSWGSSVTIATHYGLDGLGIKSRWERDFLHPARPALGPIQPPIQWVPGLSRGENRLWHDIEHPPPF
jgi:hypothetical protein